ncbi:Uma2 family endonuclease [Kineococcus terrestris]|uniref:Uma2 family endonuclease n=1 Tax=Kineococcus terrestris TaxID=2044856 RepID=UPI0034DB60E1
MAAEPGPAEVDLLHRDWTFEDLARLPDDGFRYEVLDGQLVVTPPPTPEHQDVLDNLKALLAPRVRGRCLVKTGVGLRVPRLGPERYVVPDLSLVTGPRPPLYYEPEAVLLVVEVESPGTRLRDRGTKRVLYEEHGIGEYWLADLEAQRLTSHRLRAGAYEVAWRMEGDVPGADLLDGVRFADLLAE